MKAKTFHLAIVQQAPDLLSQNTYSVTYWQKSTRWEKLTKSGFENSIDAAEFAFRRDVDLIREKVDSYRATVVHLATTPYVQGNYKTAILRATKEVAKQMFYLKAQGCTVAQAVEANATIWALFQTMKPAPTHKVYNAFVECVMLMDAFQRDYYENPTTVAA